VERVFTLHEIDLPKVRADFYYFAILKVFGITNFSGNSKSFQASPFLQQRIPQCAFVRCEIFFRFSGLRVL
jgi:hypothetical protein